MGSPGASLDMAIAGINKNLSKAVATASQLSRDGEDLASKPAETTDSSSEGGGSDGGVGSIIDVTA